MATAEEAARGKLDPEIGVAAVVVSSAGPPRDGYAWIVLVSDGKRDERIEVSASGSAASSTEAESLSNAAIERAVEQRAMGKDRERDRLAQLVADAPLILRADELHE